MDFDDFKKTTGSGGELLARQAWDKCAALVKAALPKHIAAIDAALAPLGPEVVEVAATESGKAAEGTN
jgi:hypothetical protein